MDATHVPPAFTELPGEVRNRIYRIVLLEDEVQVDATGMTEPGLLSVCKEIRVEAGPIFYAEIIFAVSITDYNAAATRFFEVKFAQIVRDFEIKTLHASARITARPHWVNLLRWLRDYHGKKTNFAYDVTTLHAIPTQGLPSASIIYAMFCTVDTLKEKTWDEVEGLMMQFRRALEVAETGWMPERADGDGVEHGEA